MTDYVQTAGLQVAAELAAFVAEDALSDSGVTPEDFWTGFAAIVADLTERNRALLVERDRLQEVIDEWLRAQGEGPIEPASHEAFLRSIGYLKAEPTDVRVTTSGVDPEIAFLAGPQLVVPVLNARFVLNAANARWGSLYDALYGTDALDPTPPAAGAYDPTRGALVVDYVKSFLDEVAPLADGRHADVTGYAIDGEQLVAALPGRPPSAVTGTARLRGFTGLPEEPASVLLEHHGLHIELRFDRGSPVGALDRAGVSDVLLEAALTTIVDFEDSVAAVDAADKVLGYRNWLGLHRGTLEERVDKGSTSFIRRLAAPREFVTSDGSAVRLPSRSLLLARTVGSHMRTDAVLDADGAEVFESFLDAALVALGARPGLDAATGHANGTHGSVYIVKPKMHGPDEVAFAVELFSRVESLVGLAQATLKIGIMDEERRTSLNLAACIEAARDRVIFINTGFLDRSGDEIHTGMQAGPVVAKNDMKKQQWIADYEKNNVEVGLRAGLPGRAQIGKGMWAMPDLMADMLEQKVAQLHTGATTAWVPSPSAATLHALHYHQVDVAAVQTSMTQDLETAPASRLTGLLTLPILDAATLDDAARRREIDSNAQSILGYVVRWVDQGVGCSKVPDISGVGLMEDRATLRISSQLLANWLLHGVITSAELTDSLQRMAAVVDRQNDGDPGYRPMAPGFDGPAFRAATELITGGDSAPNGYTEGVLHRYRRLVKRAPEAVAVQA